MGAKFPRVKVWIKERLKFADLNGEFDNILNNLGPAGVDGDSSTIAAMQNVVDPAPYTSGVQVERLATSLQGELERLRFMFKRFFGSAQWYTDPGRIVSAVTEDLVIHLPFDGLTSTEAYGDSISRGAITNGLNLNTQDFASTMLDSTNVKFGNFSYDLGASNILTNPAHVKNTGTVAAHFRNLAAGDYIAYNPLLGIELYLDGSGFLTSKLTLQTANGVSENSKATKVIAGASSRAGNTSYQHAMMRWATGNGSSLDSIGLYLSGVQEGAQLNAQTLKMNPGQGGVWFFGAKRTDPTWNKFSSFPGTTKPDGEGTDAWTLIGDTTQTAVANGVVTITVAPGETNTGYSKTNNIDLTHMTIETKCRLISSSAAEFGGLVVMNVQDGSLNQNLTIRMIAGQLLVNGTLTTAKLIAPLNTNDYHVIRATSSGSGGSLATKIYVDGVQVGAFTNSATVTATSLIKWGCIDGTELGDSVANFEYFAYGKATATAPVAGSASGQLDDIIVAKASIADSIVTQLVNNPAKLVFGGFNNYGLNLPLSGRTISTVGGIQPLYFSSDGKTPICVQFSGFASSSSNSVLEFVSSNYDLGDTIQLASLSLPTTLVPTTLNVKTVFRVGLVLVQLIFDTAGTNIAGGEVAAWQGGKSW